MAAQACRWLVIQTQYSIPQSSYHGCIIALGSRLRVTPSSDALCSFQSTTKCVIINDKIRDYEALMTIKKYISYNGMYQTDFSIMTEAAFKPYSAKVRKDIFCSVIIAEGGHQKKFTEKYKKLQVPALKFFPLSSISMGKRNITV